MTQHQNTAFADWLKALNPDEIRRNLLASSTFITAYEMLRSCVIDQVRGFYCKGFDENGVTYDEARYAETVTSRHKSPLTASLLWLKELNAIGDAELAVVDRARQHRNSLAHQPMQVIGSADTSVDVSLIGEMRLLIIKIDQWFIVNVHMATDPDFDDVVEPDLGQISSMRMLYMDLLLDAALGDGQRCKSIYEEFSAKVANRSRSESTINDITPAPSDPGQR